jgi:sugar phosphate isomerase/epimerase
VARSDKLKSLSFWFDVGNYCVVNGPRLDAPAALSPRIRYLQVKDFMRSSNGELTFCALGQGDIPIGQFLDTILPASPDPCVCVETDVQEDRRDAIVESIAFLRSYALEGRKG